MQYVATRRHLMILFNHVCRGPASAFRRCSSGTWVPIPRICLSAWDKLFQFFSNSFQLPFRTESRAKTCNSREAVRAHSSNMGGLRSWPLRAGAFQDCVCCDRVIGFQQERQELTVVLVLQHLERKSVLSLTLVDLVHVEMSDTPLCLSCMPMKRRGHSSASKKHP